LTPSARGAESEFISPGRIRGEIKRGALPEAILNAGNYNGNVSFFKSIANCDEYFRLLALLKFTRSLPASAKEEVFLIPLP